jgi:hypothetical protein
MLRMTLKLTSSWNYKFLSLERDVSHCVRDKIQPNIIGGDSTAVFMIRARP